jgi:SOS response regulatory protein OraA/RecX
MMWLLARREYAAVDLRKKALSKGHLAEEVEAALQSFQALGLQDDTRYAGMKARQCAPRYGNRRVEQVLKTKSIDSDIVTLQLAELPDEAERAARLIEQFASQVWDQALQQKVWRRLATRGFGTGVIKTALAALKLQCAQTASEREDAETGHEPFG